MDIFAHRGIFDTFPENSYRALKVALDGNFSIETDLRLTKDGDFVIIHDDNLQRLCGNDIPVASLTLDKLKKQYYIDQKGNQLEDTLISLRKFCQLFLKYPHNLLTAFHVKADSQTGQGLQLIADYFKEFNLYERAFVFDLTLEGAKRMRKIDPKVKIALIVSEHKFEPTVYLWKEVRDFDFNIVWAAELKKLYSKEFIDEVKKTGRAVYCMSPDVHKAPHILHLRAYEGYEETWKDLIRWGSEGICTDLPEKLRLYQA